MVFPLHVSQWKYVNDHLYLDIYRSRQYFCIKTESGRNKLQNSSLFAILILLHSLWTMRECVPSFSTYIPGSKFGCIPNPWKYRGHYENTPVILIKLRLNFFSKENVLSIFLHGWVKVSYFIILQYTKLCLSLLLCQAMRCYFAQLELHDALETLCVSQIITIHLRRRNQEHKLNNLSKMQDLKFRFV